MRRRVFAAALASASLRWGARAVDVPYTRCTPQTADTGMEMRNFDVASDTSYSLALGLYTPVAPGRGAAYTTCPGDASGQAVPVLENQNHPGVFAWYVNKQTTRAASPESDNMGWWFVSSSGASACLYTGTLTSYFDHTQQLAPLLGNVGMNVNSTNWPKSTMVAGDFTVYDPSRKNPYPVDSPDRTDNDFDTGYRFVCTGSVAQPEPETTTDDVVVGNQFCTDWLAAATYCGTYRATYDLLPTVCEGGAYIFQNIQYPERILWYYWPTRKWLIGDSAGAAYTTNDAESCRFDYGVVILTTSVTPAQGGGGVPGSIRSILGATEYVLAANATSFVPQRFTLEAPAGNCPQNPQNIKVLGAGASTAPDADAYAGLYAVVSGHPCRAYQNANGRAIWFSVDKQVAFLGSVGALTNDCPSGSYYVSGDFGVVSWAAALTSVGAFKTVIGDASAGFYAACPFDQGATTVPLGRATKSSDVVGLAVAISIGALACLVMCCGLACYFATKDRKRRRKVTQVYTIEHERLLGGETRVGRRHRVVSL